METAGAELVLQPTADIKAVVAGPISALEVNKCALSDGLGTEARRPLTLR